MKKLLSRFWPLLVFMLLAAAPFTWFSGKEIIFGPDSIWTANNSVNIQQDFQTWKSSGFGYGWSDSGVMMHHLLIGLFTLVHFSYPITQKLIIGLIIFSSALFMYMLFREVIDNDSPRARCLAVVAALFYVVNPFAMTWVWWRFLGVIYVYPVWPLILLTVIKLLRNKFSYKEAFIYALLISLFGSGISAIILFFTLCIAILILVSTYMFLYRNVEITTIIKKSTFFSALLVLINAYWLIPGLLMINNSISGAITAYDPTAAFILNSQSTSIYDVLRLWGSSALHGYFMGQSYFGLGVSKLIGSSLFAIVLLYPIFATILVCTKLIKFSKLRRAILLSFLLIGVSGIFLTKGANEPLALVNLSITHLQFGAAFRTPYDKFAYFIVITYAIFVPITIFIVKNKYARLANIAALSLYIGIPLIVFYSPSLMLSHDKQSLKGVVTQVPAEYSRLSNLGLTEHDKILVLPSAYHGESSYNWPSGAQTNSHDVLSNYTPSDIVFLPNGNMFSDNLKDQITGELFSGKFQPSTINSVLHHVGIDYIFIHKDWNLGFMLDKVPHPDYYQAIVNNIPGIHEVEGNKYYALYKLDNDNSERNSISIPSYIVQANVHGDDLLKQIADSLDSAGRNSVVIPSSNGGLVNFGTPTINNESLNYKFDIQSSLSTLTINRSVYDAFSNKQAITVDGKPYSLLKAASSAVNDNLPLNLSIGSHDLGIGPLSKVNVTDSSLNSVPMDIIQDWQCGNKFKSSIYQKNELNNTFVRLVPQDYLASCLMLDIGKVQPSQNILLSFRYRTYNNNGARAIVFEDSQGGTGGPTTEVVNQELTKSKNWATTLLHFQTKAGMRYRLMFYSDIDDNVMQDSYTDYSDIRSVSLPIGFAELFYINAGQRTPRAQTATLIKTNNISHELLAANVKVKGDLVVDLNSAYDSNWRAYIVKRDWRPRFFDNFLEPHDSILISSSNHMVLDGYSNGWQLNAAAVCGSLAPQCEKNADNSYGMQIVAEYVPQRWLNLGVAVSVATLLLSCLSILALSFRRIWNSVRAK